MADHSHDEFMGRKETDRLIEMFQRSLTNINTTLTALDTKLDDYALMAHDVSEIKGHLIEINGSVQRHQVWQAGHERTHELGHAEEEGYREGRDSVIGQIGWGWKALGAALALAVVAGEAYRLVESL